ncbi:MAG: RNA polymerase subunit sigma [Betaproteobacteria bacterium HGW-Betaproteobacteria-22]|nr:MAG: RNA polymerase subunit sigma [Betaproteobacteria bacterium HGW-Betaproteobacteria-22]
MTIDTSVLNALRPDMTRFAYLLLRDQHAVEDVIQETMLTAIEKQDGFKNKSSLKTWLFSILRNKTIDALRRGKREVNISTLSNDEDDSFEEVLFNHHGAWNLETKPNAWSNPDASFEQKQFWSVFDACLNHLPAQTSRIFMMREFLEFEVEDICKELSLTTSNCWVILHRARTKLRLCLDTKWFSGQGFQASRS